MKSDFFKLKREINKNPTVKSLFNGETLEYLSKLGTSSCQHVCSVYSGQYSKTHKVSQRHKGWGGRNKFTIFILVWFCVHENPGESIDTVRTNKEV